VRTVTAWIVPKGAPNDDARAIELPSDLDIGLTWEDHLRAAEPYFSAAGYFMCKIEVNTVPEIDVLHPISIDD